ncbi:DNA internalization-related competence protein ComEC/Rec2 [Variovorax sp. OV329]|uniref:DNA internalization-related competence protein ComEC/Rec2 n=1 Tax=Variovorax sp. OV329 TaxID=1882825 RepID=UPI0008E2942A|nr:DNA internalization-related competence protein ComEC/Rec2 [Variovorax sp. OV329]SFM05989.1 competence protein ComEC [Variovorax sp. OV329]
MSEFREAARAAWPFAALGGWVLGDALQLRQPALWAWPGYAALAVLGLLAVAAIVWWRTRWTRFVLLAALVGGACLGAGVTGLRACAFATQAIDPADEGRELVVTGTVAQMPQRFEGGIRFRFDVDGSPPDARLPPGISLGWYAEADAGASRPRAGERWRFTVRLKAPHGSRNPHGFDYELWAWEQGVQATGYVRLGPGDSAPVRLSQGWAHPVERAREAVRDAIEARVDDRKVAGVIAALVTGDQSAIERADWDVFRATGVAHLMSISGLHVTLFAWLAGWAVGALWRRSARLMLRWPAPHAALAGGVLLAGAYALFSGWGVPSQRTVCMLAVVALLRIAGLRWPWPMVWLCACAAVVALDPWALTQAGFWLSFVAVGVLFASDAGAPVHPGGLRGAGVRMLREQAVVTLALTPLGLLLFQQVSVVGLLANLVAIPWVTLGVLPLALLGTFVPPLWTAAAWAVQALMWLLHAVAAWPWATLSWPAPPLWAAAAGVAGGLLLAMRLPWQMRVLGLPLLLPALLWLPPRPPTGEFELLAADVGQGAAVLVRTAHHSLLYDAGPRYGVDSDAGQRVLVPLLRALGERLDEVVLSHRDSDHTGGAAAVLAMQPQAGLLSSIEAGHPLQKLRPARRCLAGQHWEWDGVRFELLHPSPGDEARPGIKPNALSCVLRIVGAHGSALLAGDIERDQEAALAAAGVPHADFLLAPHHGSKTSSSAVFLDAVAPRLAVVQAGYRNRFGHPAPEVLARYAALGVPVADTAACGAVRWRSSEPAGWRCEREVWQRYWEHRIR